MKKIKTLLAVFLGLFVTVWAIPAFAQPAPDNGGSASPGQVREEVHSLINDLSDPNYDFSKIPERMREVFQDFGSATANMDPDTARQFRQDLMQQLRPVLDANRSKIEEAMRLAFLKSLQQPLGCSDDEFAALRPYLEKVVNAYTDAQVMRFGFRGNNRPNQQNQNGNQQNGQNSQSQQKASPVQQAVSDLQTTLSDQNASSDLIHNKLDVLRQARDKARQDLAVARGQLQQLLTQRQEAVLVEYGLLE